MQSRIAWFAICAALFLCPREAPAPIRMIPEKRGEKVAAVEIEDVSITPSEGGHARVALRVRAFTSSGTDVADFGEAKVALFEDGQRVRPDGLTLTAPKGGGPGFVLGFNVKLDGESHDLRVRIAASSASREAVYPVPPASLAPTPTPSPTPSVWSWAPGTLIVLALLGASLAMWRLRGGGSLSVLSGPGSGSSIALRRGTTRIGAFEENDLVLDSSHVSRHHAQVIVRSGRAALKDLHSTNGTLVNGVPVEHAVLSPGDRIQIGDVELFYDR